MQAPARAVCLHVEMKMPSKTIRQAEKKALDGDNDSQDTLVLAHCLMRDYGVGLVRLLSKQSIHWQGQADPERHCADQQLTTPGRSHAPAIA